MILRITDDNRAIPVRSVKPDEEERFLQVNSTGKIKYIRVSTLPPSRYGFYKYDPTTGEIIVDTERELTKAKEDKIKEISDSFKRFRKETGKMKSAVLNGILVDANESAVINVSSLIVALPSDYTGTIEFRTADNTFVNMTLDELKQLYQELVNFGIACYQKKWSLEQQVQNATTFEEIDSISWVDEDIIDELSPFNQ